MANELQAEWTSGLTVYFLLRSSTGTIWNGTSLVTYVSANYATYKIAGTEQGTSGYYAGNMPAVAADIYSVVAKLQAGGAPAESDVTVGQQAVFPWNGTAVVDIASLVSTGLDNVLIESGITASAALTNDAGAQLTSINARQALALCQSILAGLTSGIASNAPVFTAAAKTAVTRLSGTNDTSNDRTAATIVVPT